MPVDTYSLVLTKPQLLLVLKSVKAACQLYEAMAVIDGHDIETLLVTLTEVESDNAA